MNLEGRVLRYAERGFQRVEAEILVLIEESAAAIFTSFPHHFILFGGAALVIFYESPRLSRDLDLLASPASLTNSEEIQAAVRSSIQPIAETLGVGQIEFRNDATGPDIAKHWVIANRKPLFSIDLTRIGGSVLNSQIVEQPIASEPERNVLTPTANYLLFQKCEAFLNRRYVKVRDAFDIHFLITRGALLDKHLHAHLEDFVSMKEIDRESIDSRIENISPKLCTVELRPILPLAVFKDLAKYEFEPIRRSLRNVLSHWLGEQKQ